MQEFLTFFVTVIVVSISGVITPGPLFASTLSSRLKQSRVGFRIALGHTVVELPLILLIGLGVISLESFSEFRTLITIFGSASIFVFVAFQIRSLFRKVSIKKSKYDPFVAGILLTGLNPFFLVWWFTIGMKLIADSIMIWSFWGIGILFGLHIWMDYVWLGFVSMISSKGASFLTGRPYKLLFLGINCVMVYFGVAFLLDIF